MKFRVYKSGGGIDMVGIDTSTWKEFKLTDIGFSVHHGTRLTKENRIPGDIPFITAGEENRGIADYISNDLDRYENPITIDMFGNCFFHDGVFSGDDNIYFFINDKLSNHEKIFISTIISKKLKGLFSYDKQFRKPESLNLSVSLPAKEVEEPDWDYMQSLISELESERISELGNYLIASSLNDYELTEEEKKTLSAKRTSGEKGNWEDTDTDEVRFGEFVLGGEDGLFDIYSPKKRFNANTVSFGGDYPYVARGATNNGIRGYITEDTKYLSPAKSLSFGQDTATVYYQPDSYFTGDKIKIMVLKDRDLTPELAEYFVASITKAFSNFAWGQNSFNENIIKSMKIQLPITPDGAPDFDYMERYIRAMEKIVIADVVKYKDKVIETTRSVIN